MLGDVNRGAAVFTPERKALHQSKRDQHDRSGNTPAVKAGEQTDEKGADAHQRHRDQEGVFASDHVAETTEDQRAERTYRKARCKREQRENEADIRRHVGEEVLRQERAKRSIDVKIVPFEDGAEGGSENDFSLFSSHSSG